MTSRVHSYRVVLPQPWVRIPVGTGTEARVHQLVEERMRETPKELPPDQVGPLKRELERRMVADVRRAREYGGVDFYLPADLQHGLLIGASFVVSEVRPPGQLPEGPTPDEGVGAVLAELAQNPGAQPVVVAEQAWVRTQQVIQPDQGKAPGVDVPMVTVTYTTALPDDPARWVLVQFSGSGDGDPDSEATALLVELFDAIISTWRWIESDDDRWGEDQVAGV